MKPPRRSNSDARNRPDGAIRLVPTVSLKALVVREPWASQIESGSKTKEYRSRPTKHRGPLLICMAKHGKPARGGMGICIVNVVDCKPARRGGYAWYLADVKPIQPVPVKGQLNMFNVTIPKPRSRRVEAS